MTWLGCFQLASSANHALVLEGRGNLASRIGSAKHWSFVAQNCATPRRILLAIHLVHD